ncbi:MAG: hypothetical protein ACTSQH_08790 [Candidatus Hodarchaeales archaeon]
MHLSGRRNKKILESLKKQNEKSSTTIAEGADLGAQPGDKEKNVLDTSAAAKKADSKDAIDKAVPPGNTGTPKGKEAPDTGSMKGKGIDKVKAEALAALEVLFNGMDEAAGIVLLESVKSLKEGDDKDKPPVDDKDKDTDKDEPSTDDED